MSRSARTWATCKKRQLTMNFWDLVPISTHLTLSHSICLSLSHSLSVSPIPLPVCLSLSLICFHSASVASLIDKNNPTQCSNFMINITNIIASRCVICSQHFLLLLCLMPALQLVSCCLTIRCVITQMITIAPLLYPGVELALSEYKQWWSL